MAKPKYNAKKVSYISVPSEVINSLSSSSLQTLLLSPKKPSRNRFLSWSSYKSPRVWFFGLFLFGFLGMLKLWFDLDPLVPFYPYPCLTSQTQGNSFPNGYSRSQLVVPSNGQKNKEPGPVNGMGQKSVLALASSSEKSGESAAEDEPLKSIVQSKPLLSNGYGKSDGDGKESEFWMQPDGLGYKPCLDFSSEYRRGSEVIVKDRRKYLLVVVSGGMNQQRNQIVDAVVIARILGAALVVPILQVNVIWGDER